MSELKDRIREARTGKGFTQPELAEKIGLTKNFVSLIENGQRSPSDRTISDISRGCGVNEEWLRTGGGEMRRPIGREEELSDIFASLEVDDTVKAKFIRTLASIPEEYFVQALKFAHEKLKQYGEEEIWPDGK